LTFWSSGSLALSTWPAVTSVLPFALLGGATAAYVARSLDVLALGDRSAAAAGVDVRRVRIAALAAVVLLVGAGVGAVGVIAFVGLLVPHAVRAVLGPRHRGLLLVSALAGALLLLVADTVARLLANPLELPIGAVTAAIGAPAFFVLLRRTRARQGGWA
jgi:iron complex transport system permease protein